MEKKNKVSKKGGGLLIEEHISAAIFCIMTLLGGVNIISRILADLSLAFTEELIVYLFVVATMFGAAAGAQRGLHMGLTLIVDAVPGKYKLIFYIASTASICALFGLLAFQGAQMVISQIQYGYQTPVMHLPTWWFSSSLCIGSIFFIVRTIACTIKQVKEVL